ncbi:TetR/AcrR family transcriptional regulator [Mycolicibacter sp. MYC123]|uniref:TetR/AcrR family transcriptional regulator n=1 Tax=[Mycobacterium] zoologicum TaxID=2872311 RepID=A0ABU5YNI9_9MYCO|nr:MULTISPECIES: TetR/AcrR family transcriptional regulator [unclassified Mycolicibacter]MEB3051620.1 TetR/AcrR family transcriptional regulator [Mycolicibacter sp. MYC123]MEB3064573.1 TetR/AcrR family transcriptional regulator [Mycolicibacter sp. MYC101]
MTRREVVRDYGGISAVDRRAERRAKLLAAGRQLWGESGLRDVTVRGVCAEAGLIPRYFYEQFGNRDALIFAVSDDVRDQLLETLVTAGVADPGTLTDKLRSALTAFLDRIAADPHIHRIATDDLSGVPGLTEHRAHILEMIADLIVQLTPGVLGSETPEPAELRRGALFLVGGVNQIIESWLADPVESTAELATVCADLCVSVVRNIIVRPPDPTHH